MLGVLERSRDICLSLYTEGPFDEEKEATQLLKRNSTALAPLSFAVLVSHTVCVCGCRMLLLLLFAAVVIFR